MPSIQIILPFLLIAVISYLLGSISFSIIFTRLFRRFDVREKGSGNAGATNVLRTAGKAPALLTFIFDFSKGIAAILLSLFLFKKMGVSIGDDSLIKFVAGLFCLLGHIFPVYFGFRGGKGVLTCAALIVLIDPRIFAIGISIFIIVLIITRIVSISSILGSLSFPVSTFVIHMADKSPYTAADTFFAFLIAAIIVYMHRSNIKRLIRGEESKLGQPRNKDNDI